MLDHEWPGNVRELDNRIQRAVLVCKTATITPADLGLEGKITNRPVLLRDRFVSRTRSSAPTAARTPVRPTHDWSATPVTARVARQ